jgi:hypothetical protein
MASTRQKNRRGGRRGPRRIQLSVSPGLAAVLDALADLYSQPPAQVANPLVLAALAHARHDPAVQAAMRARGNPAGLHAVSRSS